MYKVKDYNELRRIVFDRSIPLDLLDVSEITDMRNIISNDNNLSLLLVKSFSLCGLFYSLNKINGSVANWNTSNVTDMEGMFLNSDINQDISNWDISKVEDMEKMFYNSEFSQNLGAWDFTGKNIIDIFRDCPYSLDLYAIDREKYLNNIALEKEKAEQKELSNLNKELSKDIDLITIEMEF